MTLGHLLTAWGLPSWFPYQQAALDGERHVDSAELKACLYYRTGAGKTYTALALMVQAGVDDITVVAPPKTHSQWQQHAAAIGMKILTISHAKYRQAGYKVSRLRPVIIDEFHMLGGQDGTGFKKIRTHARHIQAPLILLSATPNYNDVERVYCVQHVLDPMSTRGGYLEWLYANCKTRQNPYAMAPLVDGFLDGEPAKVHLAALPHVYYVEDENEDFPIYDVELDTVIPSELDEYGLDQRNGRIVASRMEFQSTSRKHQLIAPDGLLWGDVTRILLDQYQLDDKPMLVFCARAEIAKAAAAAISEAGWSVELVTYHPNQKHAMAALQRFKSGQVDVLVGTATMATGVDGLDQVCDHLIILDDTDDASLRRQVIGRILPRGSATDVSKKRVTRLLLGVT